MEKLTEKEQVLLAYYVYNFLEKKDKNEEELKSALHQGVKDGLQGVQKELVQDGFLKEQEQEITNEGSLHIDSILHIQSYATERNKLAYIKDSLQINEIEFTIEPIRDYIYKNVEMDKPSIH